MTLTTRHLYKQRLLYNHGKDWSPQGDSFPCLASCNCHKCTQCRVHKIHKSARHMHGFYFTILLRKCCRHKWLVVLCQVQQYFRYKVTEHRSTDSKFWSATGHPRHGLLGFFLRAESTLTQVMWCQKASLTVLPTEVHGHMVLPTTGQSSLQRSNVMRPTFYYSTMDFAAQTEHAGKGIIETKSNHGIRRYLLKIH